MTPERRLSAGRHLLPIVVAALALAGCSGHAPRDRKPPEQELALPHLLAGRASELTGDEARAEEEYRLAIRLTPTLGPARYQLGRLLLLRAFLERVCSPPTSKDPLVDEGVHELEEAFRSTEGWGSERGRAEQTALAMRALMGGDLAKAEWICEQATAGAQTEGLEELYWILGCAREGQDRADAFSIAIDIREDYALALLCRGWERQQQEASEMALLDFDSALASNPRLTVARLLRSKARYAVEDFAGAIEDLDAFLKEHPRHAAALLSRAQALRAAGDLTKAIEGFTAAASADPDLLEPVFRRGAARAEAGDHAGAMKDLGDGLRRAPEGYEGKDRWEVLYLNSLNECVKTQPAAVADWVRDLVEGAAAIARHDYPEARHLCEEGFRIGGADAEKDRALKRLVATGHYTLACVEALLSIGKEAPNAEGKAVAPDEAAQHRDRAFQHLERALAMGADRILAEDDADLAALRDDPRWKQVFGQ